MSEPKPNDAFGSEEILFYKNGRWGDAGYALPNPGGKTWTNNTVIKQLVELIGRNMFELMHRQDVRYYVPPHKQFWFDLHQLIITARKRLSDRVRTPNDSNGLDPTHAAPVPQMFIVFPLPYFGERVRQQDIREFCQLGLMLQAELMQHSDNERGTYVTPGLVGVAHKYLQEILALLATKYFGYTRAQAYAADFALKDTDFQGYDPAKVMTSIEMTEERPPLQWWPTENDLSAIRGLPLEEALLFATRWPATELLYSGDGHVTHVNGQSTVGAQVGVSTGGFTSPPGQAP